jgi:hypothetical protein
MAATEEQCGRYRIHLRWHGKQQKFPLGKVAAEEAASKAAQVNYLSMQLKQRLFELPPGLDIVEFVQFDGKPPADLQEVSAESRELTLAGFRDRYLATHSGSLEDRTIEGIGPHFKHLTAALGERFPIGQIGHALRGVNHIATETCAAAQNARRPRRAGFPLFPLRGCLLHRAISHTEHVQSPRPCESLIRHRESTQPADATRSEMIPDGPHST